MNFDPVSFALGKSGKGFDGKDVVSYLMGRAVKGPPTPPTPADKPYLTFSSPTSFTMGKTNGKTWDGTVEYSTDANTWTTWNGTDTLTAVSDSGTYYIYLRGISNTAWGRSSKNDQLTLTGSNISVAGNIETLLDYATVALGNHPQMAGDCFKSLLRNNTALVSAENLELPATTLADFCYATMFQGCTSLVSAPALPATTIANYCYYGMFNGCTSLTSVPALPATTLMDHCYEQMFFKCSSLKISTTQTGEYQYAYRIPTEGTGTTAVGVLDSMFARTGGTFTGTPSINTTYYTDHEPV